jgi:CRISPR-associated protein Csm5
MSDFETLPTPEPDQEPAESPAEPVVPEVPVPEAAEPVLEAAEPVLKAAEPVPVATEPVLEAAEPVPVAAEPVPEPVAAPVAPAPPPAPRRVVTTYRVTCLTPTLVGDGYKLSPIDYMVWRDQVNVLDQARIFKLLAKGPRLDGYLTQIKKATKLDFASWGGFAQNYAGRRIPFESAASSKYWERAATEQLAIPTFASGASGPYLPAAAIKGALRTGLLFGSIKENTMRGIAERVTGERPLRHPGSFVEDQLVGISGSDRMRLFSAGDSAPINNSTFRIYLLRTATLATSRIAGSYALAWKQSPRGSVTRPEDSTPTFAEMADPGTAFQGPWSEKGFFDHQEVRRALRWDRTLTRRALFAAANKYAAAQLALHRQYAVWTGIDALLKEIGVLEEKLRQAEANGACLLSIGWGGGFIGKSSAPDTSGEDSRKILGAQAFYQRAIQSGLPFPKTRRVVFTGDRPSTLPGWVYLEVA